MNCKLCGLDGISLPSDLATLTVVCTGCNEEQRVRDYVSDADRLRAAAQEMMRARAAAEQTRREGIACPGCGGTTALPLDSSARDFQCEYCGHHLLVADYVDARVLAGAELRAGVEGLMGEHQARRRRQAQLALGAALFGIALIVVVALLSK